MSDFFRIPANPELSSKTLRQLAELMHQAEDTGDDFLLMQCHAEVTARGQDYVESAYTELYRQLWRERMAKR